MAGKTQIRKAVDEKRQFNCRLAASDIELINRLSRELGMSKSAFIRQLLRTSKGARK